MNGKLNNLDIQLFEILKKEIKTDVLKVGTYYKMGGDIHRMITDTYNIVTKETLDAIHYKGDKIKIGDKLYNEIELKKNYYKNKGFFLMN